VFVRPGYKPLGDPMTYKRWLFITAVVVGMLPMYPTCVPQPGPFFPVVQPIAAASELEQASSSNDVELKVPLNDNAHR